MNAKLPSPIVAIALPFITASCLNGGLGRTTRVPEVEPNDSRDQALSIGIPGATTGIVGRNGDSVDWVRIEVPQDATVVVELRNISRGDRTTEGKDLDRFVVEGEGHTIARGSESRLEPGITSSETIRVSKGQVLWVAIRPHFRKGTEHSPEYTLIVKQRAK